MATLISSATGNFTASGTWKVADATTELDSEAGSTASTTAYVASANFTPGAITVDAIAVKVASRTAGATGTVSIELYNSTGASSVATATIDAADMPLTGGWVVLPIGSTLLLAATNYQIRFKTSVTGTVTLYRNATAGNWSRQLRTTTNQAPAAGDKLIVAGEHTGSGTGNNFTVTMDETAATIYGNVSFTQSITVNKRGTLSYGTTASTNYLLKLAGIFKVWSDGIFNIGTTGTPIPSTSTAKLEFSVATNVDSGLEVGSGGTFNSQGVTLHTVERALLNANAAVSDTVLTTDVTVGWKSGDQIALASTTRTVTQGELRTLSVDSSGTTVTVSSGLTYAHDGVAPVQAEVINLNRNVKICGTSATLCAYVLMATTSVSDCDFTEFYYLGSSTANKHGVEVQTTTGSASFNSCAFHTYFSTAATAVGVYSASTTLNNLSVVDCNFWNTNYLAVYLTAANTTFNASLTFTGNWCINGATGTTYGFLIAPVEATVSNNRIAGYGVGLQIINAAGGKLGTHSGNIIHSCTAGVTYQTVFDGTISNTTIWRTGGQAFNIGGCSRVVVDGVTTFGNVSGGITMANNQDCVIKNFVSNSQASYTQPYGVYLTGLNPRTVFYNCSFGATTGHTTADIVTTTVFNGIIFHKCTFSSSTELSVSTWRLGGGYFSQDHQNVAGSCKRVAWEGTSTRDTVIYNNASPSLRMAPAQTVVKLRSPYFSVAVASGNTSTPSVWVRKSVVGDGTAYNGAQPRLMVKANPTAGILSDTVLDTAAAAAGSWEELTGTTAAVSENTVLEFFVDCDGTQGWINVDDMVTVNDGNTQFEVWADGVPAVFGTGPTAMFTDVTQSDVRDGISYKFNSLTNNRTGTLDIPPTSKVEVGFTYDNGTKTGTFTGNAGDNGAINVSCLGLE